jgi:nucleotide-binding universal stress UspA family protein
METVMPVKDVAVLLQTEARTDVASPYAISFASAFGAHLTGIGIAMDMIVPAPIMSEIPTDVFAAAFAKAKTEAAAACARLDRDATLAGISVGSHLITGSPGSAEDEFARLARHFDLTIIQQPEPDSLGDEEILIESALFGSGRPVIIVPYTQQAAFKCHHIVVAWDESVSATRAIAAALPVLQSAGKVQLVVVGEKKQRQAVDLPGFNITRHLARHAINAELQKLPNVGDVADTLLSHVADASADLLVMGAYGHSRLREFILGGATRGVLAAMTVPVVMAH